jgi:hypothetical protein
MKPGPIDWRRWQVGMPTLHGKQSIVQSIFADWQWQVSAIAVDTNQLGTFAGDIERTLAPPDAARAKIALAKAAMPGMDAYIASEGSFYPHPQVPLLTLNTEILVLHHPATNRWFQAAHTDYFGASGQLTTNSWHEVLAFALQLGFPEQGLILMTAEADKQHRRIVKDARHTDELHAAFEQLAAHGPVIAEPDFRAHRSPERQRHIATAARALREALESQCPQCGSPGFAKKKPIAGLPCSCCGTPTRLIKAWLYQCDVCRHEAQKAIDQPAADPGSCDVCNP